MYTKKVLVLAISSLFLVACGSSNSSTETKTTIAEPTLQEIAGVWKYDMEQDESDLVTLTEAYMVITESGELNTYVYLEWAGELQDYYDNCYSYDADQSDTITDFGNGSFEFYLDGESATTDVTIVDDNLIIGGSFDNTSLSKDAKQESDLTPLCDFTMETISVENALLGMTSLL